jgi:hypothetical protein
MSQENLQPYELNWKIFKSPQEFYFFIKNGNYDFPELYAFMDNMDLFLNGCPCESESYWGHVLDEYRYFRRRDFTNIKQTIGCSKIEFSFDNLKFIV